MLLALALVTGIASLAIIIAGAIVFFRNTKEPLNRTFALMSVTTSAWGIFNFLGSNTASGITPVLVKLDFTFALLIAYLLMRFAYLAATKRGLVTGVIYRSFVVLAIALAAIAMPAIFYDQVFIVNINNGLMVLTPRVLYAEYMLALIAAYAIAMFALLKAYRLAKSGIRSGLLIICIGFAIALLTNISSNIVFPEIVDNRELVLKLNSIGYFGLVVFAFSIYFAITRRQFFDIRPVVARAIGYAMSVSVIVLVYGLFVNLIIENSIAEAKGKIVAQSFAVALVVPFFPYIKNKFDTLTTKLFYRDAYDDVAFLAHLSDLFARNTSVEELSRILTHELANTLRLSFCDVHVAHKKYKGLDLTKLPELAGPPVSINLVDAGNGNLSKSLASLGVSVVFSVPNTSGSVADKFVLIVGDKKSGNALTQQDMRVISTSVNGFSVAVQNALRFEEIERFNETLQERIHLATSKLQKTNEKLIQIDETKDEFISMASHQLRTPLTSIKGYVSMVLDGDAGPVNDMQRKLLDQAFISSQRMVFLVADLLNISRLRTGKFVIERAPVRLADIVRTEVDQLQETAESRGLTLSLKLPDNPRIYNLDETKMRQVVMNFVDNAIYYSKPQGAVNIILRESSRQLELVVQDNGIGVPKHEQHHLFDKFFRANNARRARPDGTGLGLFMAKKIIIAHGGAILFKSSEGQGSTFGFSIPVANVRTSKAVDK